MLDFIRIAWLTAFDFIADIPAAAVGVASDRPGAIIHIGVLYVVGAAVGIIIGRQRTRRNR